MKRTIKNGVTIISTGEKDLMPFNKFGFRGVYFDKRANHYKVAMQYKNHKYNIGAFKDLETARKAREVAQIYADNGTFVEWFQSKPHANSFDYMPFWESEFERMNKLENCQ